MALYVDAEYWAEGYAEGDAKLVSAVASASLSASSSAAYVANAEFVASPAALVSVYPQRIMPAASAASGSAFAGASVHRIISVETTFQPYVEDGYWADGYDAAGPASRFVVSANTTLVGSASTATSSDTIANADRIFTVDVTAIVTSCIVAANARLKWELESDTPETWTQSSAASDTWTPAASAADTWTEQ